MKKMTYAVAITGLTCAILAGGGMAAATESAEPTPEPTITLPAERLEVAFYVYKKLDPTAPASWPNSGAARHRTTHDSERSTD